MNRHEGAAREADGQSEMRWRDGTTIQSSQVGKGARMRRANYRPDSESLSFSCRLIGGTRISLSVSDP